MLVKMNFLQDFLVKTLQNLALFQIEIEMTLSFKKTANKTESHLK